MQTEGVDARRAVEELKELADLTGGPEGARRVAWTDEWEKAREWFRGKLEEIEGITEIETDEAGNVWATAPGDSERAVLIGGHIDSVPNGGWLDGALNVVGALEVMRALAPQERPVTLRLVDWADEEGARFGRSLFGSGAAAGALKPDDVRDLRTATAWPCPTPSPSTASTSTGSTRREANSRTPRPTWSCTSSRARFWNRMDLPLGVVLGTFGVERHAVRFTGQHAHSGSTPMEVRRDAFIAAARSAVAFRDDARSRDDVRATTGFVNVSPAIVTAFNGWCEMSLDQRALDPGGAGEHARRRRGGDGPHRHGGGRLRRVEAAVAHRAHPLRRRSDLPGRRGRDRSSRDSRTGYRADPCTTRPRWRASCRP